MYVIKRQKTEKLIELMEQGCVHTIFLTYPWVKFLEKNQNAEPVILELVKGNIIVTYFVGLIVQRMGVRILGSPFEGWLTCDMGFIKVNDFEINEALKDVAKYAFKNLKCWFVQIIDKNIKEEELDNSIHFNNVQALYLDNGKSAQEMLENFTSHGRRDIRASGRKNTVVEVVPFNKEFVDIYYDQLIDVFEKQGLKPFYSKEKMYDLVWAFQNYQSAVVAILCKNDTNKSIGSVLSFGYGDWSYYIGAASYRENQKLLPNEACFWRFVSIWNERKVPNIDFVGYREYKMKYNPQMVSVPVICFERIPGLLMMKNLAKKMIMLVRKIRGNRN